MVTVPLENPQTLHSPLGGSLTVACAASLDRDGGGEDGRKGERERADRMGSSQASESTARSQPTQETPNLSPPLSVQSYSCV